VASELNIPAHIASRTEISIQQECLTPSHGTSDHGCRVLQNPRERDFTESSSLLF